MLKMRKMGVGDGVMWKFMCVASILLVGVVRTNAFMDEGKFEFMVRRGKLTLDITMSSLSSK